MKHDGYVHRIELGGTEDKSCCVEVRHGKPAAAGEGKGMAMPMAAMSRVYLPEDEGRALKVGQKVRVRLEPVSKAYKGTSAVAEDFAER